MPNGHYIGFFLCNSVPGVLRRHCTGFFPVQYCLELFGQHCWKLFLCTRLFLCNFVSGVSRQHCTEIFLAQCTKLLKAFPVERCPRSIKTTLQKIFSCEMLSAVSWRIVKKCIQLVLFKEQLKVSASVVLCCLLYL